jgi:hypothetical protein
VKVEIWAAPEGWIALPADFFPLLKMSFMLDPIPIGVGDPPLSPL